MKKTNKRGFTLIELMIVVAIIGILAAVAIPAFINYMKRAKTSEATLNLKSIAEGAVSYHDTHGNTIPSEETVTPSDGALPGATPVEITSDIDDEFSSEGWQQIGWKPHKAFLYVYSFIHGAQATSDAAGRVADAIANGNLDGDDDDSTFIRPINRIESGLVKPDDLLPPTDELE